jgi:predicted transcriptional regulator
MKEVYYPTAREEKAKERKYEQISQKALSRSELKTMLTLAYYGPQNRYNVSKLANIKYPVIHRVMKGLHRLDWVTIVEKGRSMKNVRTRTYGITSEGLLWLMTKIPKEIHESIADPSTPDSLGLREISRKKDTSKLENLESANDFYLHLLFDFNIEQIAAANTALFPLIFENWDFFRKIDVAGSLKGEMPEVAFSTLVDYFYSYTRDGFHDLETLFAYKLFSIFLERYVKADLFAEEKEEEVDRTASVFQHSPPLRDLFSKIATETETKLERSLDFVRAVSMKLAQTSLPKNGPDT